MTPGPSVAAGAGPTGEDPIIDISRPFLILQANDGPLGQLSQTIEERHRALAPFRILQRSSSHPYPRDGVCRNYLNTTVRVWTESDAEA